MKTKQLEEYVVAGRRKVMERGAEERTLKPRSRLGQGEARTSTSATLAVRNVDVRSSYVYGI